MRHQRVERIVHIGRSWAEQSLLFTGAGVGLCRQPEIAGFLANAYEACNSGGMKPLL